MSFDLLVRLLLLSATAFSSAALASYTLTASDYDGSASPPPFVWASALAAASAAVASLAWRLRWTLPRLRSAHLHVVVLGLVLSYLLDRLPLFCTSFAFSPLVVVWPLLASAEFVRYEIPSVWDSGATYAMLRVLGDLFPRGRRLLPAAVGSVETLVMVCVLPSTGYSFRVGSSDFLLYASVKTAVLLGVPVIEDVIVSNPVGWK